MTSAVRERVREWVKQTYESYITEQIELHGERGFHLMQIGKSENGLRCTPEEFWEDIDFCLEAVAIDGEAIGYVPKKFLDATFCLAVVTEKPQNLKYIPKEFLSEELFLTAVRLDGLAVGWVPPMRLTKAIVHEALLQNPDAKKKLPEVWQDEIEERKGNS